MKTKIILSIFLLLILVSLISAETYTLNIRGEPRTPDGKIDLIYSAGLATDQGEIASDSK